MIFRLCFVVRKQCLNTVDRRKRVQYSQEPQYGQNPANPTEAGFTGTQRTSTNTPDPHYDLVSVLYHALGSAQTCAQYATDANRVGDQELAQFFVQEQQNQVACAEKAKQLLGRRLSPSTVH
jgi:hypothetical protein